MKPFRVVETKGFLKDIRQDFGGQRTRIEMKLKNYAFPQLRQQPYFGKNIKKLREYNPDTWRYRIGEYRFFYEIDEAKHLVIMIAADTRGNAY